MVSHDMLAELAAFNLRSIADLLGADAEVRLGEIIRDRQELVDHGLKALSLQYPGYAESIPDRQLERPAIRFESAEYPRRLRAAAIRRARYASLRGRPNARPSASADRPPVHLGLELAGMIGRVPLFASLDQAALVELGKRLRPVVALPGEKIIAQGGPPDSMYFIAAGEVQVILRGGPVTLKDGDFFGEGVLLERRPRNADVISTGYTHLLVLHRRDFNELLDQRPALPTQIQAVAARRVAETPTS